MCLYFLYFLHSSSIHNQLCCINRHLFLLICEEALGFKCFESRLEEGLRLAQFFKRWKSILRSQKQQQKSIRLSSPPFLLHVVADFLWVHWSVSKPRHEKCSREGEKISVVFWHTFRRLITTQLKCTDMCIIAETFVELHV